MSQYNDSHKRYYEKQKLNGKVKLTITLYDAADIAKFKRLACDSTYIETFKLLLNNYKENTMKITIDLPEDFLDQIVDRVVEKMGGSNESNPVIKLEDVPTGTKSILKDQYEQIAEFFGDDALYLLGRLENDELIDQVKLEKFKDKGVDKTYFETEVEIIPLLEEKEPNVKWYEKLTEQFSEKFPEAVKVFQETQRSQNMLKILYNFKEGK